MNTEKEFEKGSVDPQQTTDLINIEKRMSDLFAELIDIGNNLRITEDVLSMTTNFLLDRIYPDDPFKDSMEQVGSSLIVAEERLNKIRSDIENLPLKFKEE